jgi:hypothetical protein
MPEVRAPYLQFIVRQCRHLRITGTEGACSLVAWEPERGRATFEVTWR